LSVFVTGQVVERLPRVPDGPGRTGPGAGAAWAAVAGERGARLERHVREDRDQPETGPEPGIDEEVVTAEPAEARRPPDVLVRDVGPLPFPVDDLRGGDGQRREAPLLDEVRDEERSPVEEKVHLPVVMEVEGGRMVADVFEDGVAQPLAERHGQAEALASRGLELEIRPQRGNIRDPEKVEAEFPSEGLELPPILRFRRLVHERRPFYRRPSCLSNLTLS